MIRYCGTQYTHTIGVEDIASWSAKRIIPDWSIDKLLEVGLKDLLQSVRMGHKQNRIQTFKVSKDWSVNGNPVHENLRKFQNR